MSSGAVAAQAIPSAAWPAGLNTGVRCITPSTPGGIAKFVLAGPGLTDTTVTPEPLMRRASSVVNKTSPSLEVL